MVCKEQDRVRELDAQDETGELAQKVGRIVGRHIKKVILVLVYWTVLNRIPGCQRKPRKRGIKGKGKLGAGSTASKQPTVKKGLTVKKDPTVKDDSTVKRDSIIKAEPTKTEKDPAREKPSTSVEKKQTKVGTLDWSKAKSKAEKEKEKADELKARAEKEAREAKTRREKDREEKEKEKPKPKQVEEKPVEVVKVNSACLSILSAV